MQKQESDPISKQRAVATACCKDVAFVTLIVVVIAAALGIFVGISVALHDIIGWPQERNFYYMSALILLMILISIVAFCIVLFKIIECIIDRYQLHSDNYDALDEIRIRH